MIKKKSLRTNIYLSNTIFFLLLPSYFKKQTKPVLALPLLINEVHAPVLLHKKLHDFIFCFFYFLYFIC